MKDLGVLEGQNSKFSWGSAPRPSCINRDSGVSLASCSLLSLCMFQPCFISIIMPDCKMNILYTAEAVLHYRIKSKYQKIFFWIFKFPFCRFTGVNVLGYVEFSELIFTNYRKKVQNMSSGMELDCAVRCILIYLIYLFCIYLFSFKNNIKKNTFSW